MQKNKINRIFKTTLNMAIMLSLLLLSMVGSVTATISDEEKQQEILSIVNSHRGSIPSELVLSIIRQEGGEGAFYTNGWVFNPSIYRESDGVWAQPTNGDGMMQVTDASGYHEHSGPYTNDQNGYDNAINDGSSYLMHDYTTYGSYVQATLYYNSGPNSLFTYLGNDGGDPNYLSNVAGHLTNFVPNTYNIQNPNLVSALNQGQDILNYYLNMGLATGQNAAYYAPYQKRLNTELHAIGHELRATLYNTNYLESITPLSIDDSPDENIWYKYNNGYLLKWTYGEQLDAGTHEHSKIISDVPDQSFTQEADMGGNYWGECVSMVKSLSKIDHGTREWRGGRYVMEGGVEKGTAIGWFQADRTYDATGTNGHVAFFERYVYNSDGDRIGFYVWDQNYVSSSSPGESEGLIGWHKLLTTGSRAGDADNYRVINDIKISPKLDLVFLIDTTGSMGDDIANVKLSANEIIDSLRMNSENDYRIAVADYKDYPYCGSDACYGWITDYVYKRDLPFTYLDHRQDIIDAINGLEANGGADWEESVYSALVESMTDVCKDCINNADNYGWRKGVNKAIILMGDAPPHDPEPWLGGHTLNDVTYWSNEIDPINVYSIVVGTDPTTYAAFSEISEKTGGKVYMSPTASDVVDAIIEAIGDIEEPETYGVSVNINPTINEANPGQSVTYSINVTNTGTIADTYNISIDPQNFAGTYRGYPIAIQESWTYLDQTSIEIEPDSTETVSLTISVPNNWAGMENVIYPFDITAKSEADESIRNTSSAELKVKTNKRSMVEYSKLETIWLSDLIRSASIDDGIKNSLLAKLTTVTLKLDQAILNVEGGKNKQANNMLEASQNIINAFKNQVEAQYDKKIMQPDANMLMEKANIIIQDILVAKNG